MKGPDVIRTGANVAALVSLILTIFIVQHGYFMLTSVSSLEMQYLMEVNPFFEGKKKSEHSKWEEYKER